MFDLQPNPNRNDNHTCLSTTLIMALTLVIKVVVRMTALTPYVTKRALEANPDMPIGYFQVQLFGVIWWCGGVVW